jgi:uncharacterized protein YdaU (DUF1376 family)
VKIPYFEFYPTDWLSSTRVRLLSLEQRGAFLELLCHAWNYPGTVLPDPQHSYQDSLKTLAGLLNEKALRVLLDECFERVEGGWLNPKLAGIRDKAERIYLAKSKGGSNKTHTKTHTKTLGKNHTKTQGYNQNQNHLVQGPLSSSSDEAEGHKDLSPSSLKSEVQKDRTTNQSEGISKRGLVEPSPDAFLFASLLADSILERKKDFLWLANGRGDKVRFAWAQEFDRMLRIDGREPERLRAVLLWSQEDSFWNKNILSASKFRKQFDQLEMKMMDGGKNREQPKTFFQRRQEEDQRASEEARIRLGVFGGGVEASPGVHEDAVVGGGKRSLPAPACDVPKEQASEAD